MGSSIKTELPPQNVESLVLRLQFPMVIPKEIKELKLANQIPGGDIAYFDSQEPDQLRLVDQVTWKPSLKKGREIRESLSKATRRFAAIIVHVPARTPDNSYLETIIKLSELLRRTSEKIDGIMIHQNMGALFIIEDKGEDARIGWRQKELSKADLVVDKTRDNSVMVKEDCIISWGRRQKQHSAIDLTKGTNSKFLLERLIHEIGNVADRMGVEVDTSRLLQDAMASKNPVQTIANYRDQMNIDMKITDPDGKEIFVRRLKTTQAVSSDRGLPQEVMIKPEQNQKQFHPQETEHKPGDIITLEEKCGQCGNNFQREYYRRQGRKRWLLFRKDYCHGSHADGYPVEGREVYIGHLDLLPESMRESESKTKRNS